MHELNAPHIGPFTDFAAIDELAARAAGARGGAVLGRGASTAPSDARGFLFGYAGRPLHGRRHRVAHGSDARRRTPMPRPAAISTSTATQVCDHVVACTRAGKQAGFHVIGDRAMREVAAGLRAAADEVGVDAMVAARHRLEHVEMPDAEVIADAWPSSAWWPACSRPSTPRGARPGSCTTVRLGWERAAPMNPFGTLARAGVVLAFGSDSPITPLDPWAGVRAAAFHHDADERMTVRAAFNAHTRGGHRARRDDEAGVLRPGRGCHVRGLGACTSELVVQTPDARVASWSTDVRAGVPLLPDVSPDATLPSCVRDSRRRRSTGRVTSPHWTIARLDADPHSACLDATRRYAGEYLAEYSYDKGVS